MSIELWAAILVGPAFILILIAAPLLVYWGLRAIDRHFDGRR